MWAHTSREKNSAFRRVRTWASQKNRLSEHCREWEGGRDAPEGLEKEEGKPLFNRVERGERKAQNSFTGTE